MQRSTWPGTDRGILRSGGMLFASSRTDTTHNASWWLIVAMLLTFLMVQRHDPFAISAVRAIPAAVGLALLIGALWIGLRNGSPRLVAGATAFLQMTLFTVLGVVLAYAFAAQAGPLWDARLAAADRALGFDWLALHRALDGWPVLIWVLGLAYHSLTVQMIVVIVALSGASRFATLRVTVCAAILSGFVTILISALTPAMGNLVDPAGYRQLWPSIAWLERGLIGGLRDGSLRTLDLTMLMGIVSFPSFHATLAAIFLWALRATPRLTLVGQGWAVLTILATPIFGGHYGVDVIVGLLLAPPAIIAARWLTGDRAAVVALTPPLPA